MLIVKNCMVLIVLFIVFVEMFGGVVMVVCVMILVFMCE